MFQKRTARAPRTASGLMTEGVIWKQLLFFAIPLLLGNLFQLLYNTVDSIVVGNFVGGNALAAVGASNPIINLLVSFFTGIATGAGVLIARYFGAQDRENLDRAVHTSIVVALLAGALSYDPNVRCSHHDHAHREGGHTCGEHSCGHHGCH